MTTNSTYIFDVAKNKYHVWISDVNGLVMEQSFQSFPLAFAYLEKRFPKSMQTEPFWDGTEGREHQIGRADLLVATTLKNDLYWIIDDSESFAARRMDCAGIRHTQTRTYRHVRPTKKEPE